MGLSDLVRISRRYGRDNEFVLAGGGNASFKDGDVLYIKASGTTLADTTDATLVRMSRTRLDDIWERRYSDDPNERERQALTDLMVARIDGETGRPSVETLLHALLRWRYVVHLHPALVNGLTCAGDGRAIAERLFAPRLLWIPVVNPGYVLASHIRDAIAERIHDGGEYPTIVFLQNHGVFVGSDSVEEIETVYDDIVKRLTGRLKRVPDLEPATEGASAGLQEAADVAQRAFAKQWGLPDVRWQVLDNPELRRRVSSPSSFDPLRSFGYTPDHLVYCGARPLWLSHRGGDIAGQLEEEMRDFANSYPTAPRIIVLEGEGAVAVGDSPRVLENAVALFLDLLKVVTYAESFGGATLMPQDKIDFILNWEVEAYRARIGQGEGG